MFVIRPAQKEDIEPLVEFAFRSPRGLTSLPRNRQILEDKINLSLRSFQKKEELPGEDYFLFILESVDEKKVIGCSAVYSISGFDEPTYYFRIREGRYLEKVYYERGGSKLCSLFLLNEYRQKKVGKFLSFARFHFIKDHATRFTNELFAEMRGVILPPHYCPFWEAVGEKILHISFEDFESALDKSHTILSLIEPKEPIDIYTLPEEAQEAIGKTHSQTEAARRLLEEQGFHFQNEISIDDGGPRLVAQKEELLIFTESKKVSIDTFRRPKERALLSNCHLDFRALISEGSEGETLSDREKSLLLLEETDYIRVSNI